MIDIQVVLDAAAKILPQLPLTLLLTLLTLIVGAALGLVLAIIRIKKIRGLSQLAVLYISFMRCTPTIVQLFLIFYGLPLLFKLIHIDIQGWSAFTFAVIALGLHSAASLAEIIRSAYLAVPDSQHEAAKAVGMTYAQSLRRIIIPQMFRISLPNLGNNIISTFKETSLAFSIGVVDIMGQSQILIERSYGITVIEVYVVVSLIYWLCCMVLGRLIAWYNTQANAKYSSVAGKA